MSDNAHIRYVNFCYIHSRNKLWKMTKNSRLAGNILGNSAPVMLTDENVCYMINLSEQDAGAGGSVV